MQKDYEFLQDFIDDIHAETLDSSSQRITFPSGWSAICNQQYEGNLRPPQVLGKILRFQLEHGIPILSRKDKTGEGTCRKPPILPLCIVEPGRFFSLEHLTDQIRVVVTGYFNWFENRRNFRDYVESQRGGVPHFGLFFKKRPPCGFDESPSIAMVKASALEAGHLFASGDNQGAGVDGLLVQLWRQMMEKSFPHYQ